MERCLKIMRRKINIGCDKRQQWVFGELAEAIKDALIIHGFDAYTQYADCGRFKNEEY